MPTPTDPLLKRPWWDSGNYTIVPRQGRRIHNPSLSALLNAGLPTQTNIIAVSDLIPTAVVTPTYPVIGTTTFAQLIPSNENQGQTDFDGYVVQYMRDEGYREGGWFTRVFFGPVLAAVYPSAVVTPFRTTWDTEDMEWESVLEWIKFTPDYSTMVSISNYSGLIQQWPKIRVTYGFRPAIRHATTVREDWYISTAPFNLRGIEYEGPKPSDVSWELEPLGQNGSFPRCLHKHVQVPGVSRANGITNYIQRDIPQTNFTTWSDFPLGFKLHSEEPPFYIGFLRTAIAPGLPPIEKFNLE